MTHGSYRMGYTILDPQCTTIWNTEGPSDQICATSPDLGPQNVAFRKGMGPRLFQGNLVW